jgi:hypothetical protein
MTHTILFTREDEPETNTSLTLESKTGDTKDVFEVFHRAVAAYLTLTIPGARILALAMGDFNIGDFAFNEAAITESPTFRNHMREGGVMYLGLAAADLCVTYDRLLAQPENYYPKHNANPQ